MFYLRKMKLVQKKERQTRMKYNVDVILLQRKFPTMCAVCTFALMYNLNAAVHNRKKVTTAEKLLC